MSDTPRTLQEECYGTCWAACERIEELEAQVKAYANRIKRLEEAAQRVDDAAHSIQDWSGTVLGDALDELNKAKESKP